MWINNETGKPAWLQQHDGDVTFSTSGPEGRGKTVGSSEFFSTHREATREEIEEHAPAAKPAKTDPAIERLRQKVDGLADDVKGVKSTVAEHGKKLATVAPK